MKEKTEGKARTKAGEQTTSSPDYRDRQFELWSMAELDDPRLIDERGKRDGTEKREVPES